MITLHTSMNIPAGWVDYLLQRNINLKYNDHLVLLHEDQHHCHADMRKWLDENSMGEPYKVIRQSVSFKIYIIQDHLAAILKLSLPLSFPKS